MKRVFKTTSALALGLILLVSQSSFGVNLPSDKTIEKARTMVEKASPDDWQMLAKAADMCITKKLNLTEAKSWLEKSLSIKESAIGHEVAGDYYLNSKLYREAISHYVKSMKLIKQKDNTADLEDIQAKVEKAVTLSKK